MSTGYSGTPLVRKLGIKPGHRVGIVGAPRGYLTKTLGKLPTGAVRKSIKPGAVKSVAPRSLDVLQFFTRHRAELEGQFQSLRALVDENGAVWVCWPKKSSGVASDLDGNAVREIGLRGGLVDCKVCAVDETWSGLKFMVRVADRKGSR